MPRKSVKGKGRGGKRPGAGRKKQGEKRKEVSKEAATYVAKDPRAFNIKYPILPLDHMMRVINYLHPKTGKPMTEEEEKKECTAERRDDCAKAAAPFVHHRLAAIEVSGPEGGPVRHSVDYRKFTDDELMLFETLLSKAMIVIVDEDDATTVDAKALPHPDAFLEGDQGGKNTPRD